ncbi:MAG TPA: hypothetical protein DEB40_02040 [Elusimicrobia bacterium]|nr:hypothetical protein [Elusimicrobiota bacterium]HBT60511.1 hypothetical protein [Elusimicrobiota bacterium]
MADNEDFDLPDQDIPAVDIPNLKKKEKERKKAGAAWSSGAPKGPSFTGAAGGAGRAGAGVARSAASAGRAGAGEAAAGAGEAAVGAGTGTAFGAGAGAEAGFFAQLFARAGAIFSSLTSTLPGKAAVLAAAALLIGAVAVGVYRLFGAHGDASAGMPDLGALSSTIQVGNDSDSGALDYAAGAGKGLINWGNTETGLGPKTEDGPQTGKGPRTPDEDAGKKDGVQTAQEGMLRDRMARDLSGSRLSSSLGGAFGASNIFTGGPTARFGPTVGQGGKGGNLSKFSPTPSKLGQRGVLSKARSRASANMRLRGIRANKPLAQLRSMTPYNAQMRDGGTSASEINSAAASTQFEGTQTQGGAAPAAPVGVSDGSPGAGAGTGASTGAGDGTGGSNPTTYTPTIEQCGDDQYWNGTACTSLSVSGMNVTPWQGMVDTTKTLVSIAAMLLVIAGVLILLGRALMGFFGIGAILIAIGMVIAGIAAMLGAVCLMLGAMINMQGGSPQGNISMIAGGVIIVAAAATMASGVAGIVMGLVLSAIASIGTLVARELGK